MATCTDCGDQGAECLTAERVRVCVSCLYERAARERDALRDELARIHRLAPVGRYTVSAPHEEEILRLREEVSRCHDSLREADYAIRQAYAERDEARAKERRDVVDWLHNGADLADADGLIYGPYQDAIEMVADGIANGCHERAPHWRTSDR